jgi:hypothetical protein
MPTYAYEDIATLTVPAGRGPMRISRSFSVPAGPYEVIVVVKEPTPAPAAPVAAAPAAPAAATEPAATPPAPKASLISQTVEIPDFWAPEFSTSSVIVAERLEPVAAPLTPEQTVERPYVLGSIELVPALSARYTKSSELMWFFFIYNARADGQGKPDVSVEYNFYKKDEAGVEAYYNKMSPQPLNAETLPPQFSIPAGHQLQTGQALPLQSFPEGEYRLEIKVTDRLANTTINRDVSFTVSGS